MSSVVQRINKVKQPRGGYLNPKCFKAYPQEEVQGKFVFYDEENVSPNIIGLVVDYMTRYMLTGDKEEAFSISLKGAKLADEFFDKKGSLKKAKELLEGINIFEDESIKNACNLVQYDVWVRNLAYAATCEFKEIEPDKKTISNIIVMIRRAVIFYKIYGPITDYEFTFNKNAFTVTVDSGDGDFLTKDTMWDLKVTKNEITKDHTLQLLMYWIMGNHSGEKKYRDIKHLGIFNPRKNIAYICDVDEISDELIKEIEKEVICYE